MIFKRRTCFLFSVMFTDESILHMFVNILVSVFFGAGLEIYLFSFLLFLLKSFVGFQVILRVPLD